MARTYIAASYAQRYCESSGVFVALRPLGDDGDVYRRVEAAAAAALNYEEAYEYRAKDLFTLAELRYWMHELAQGTVIYLAR